MNNIPHKLLPQSISTAVLVTSTALKPRTGERVRGLHPAPKMQPRRRKIGRNDPCPCESGKKFKDCHHPSNRG